MLQTSPSRILIVCSHDSLWTELSGRLSVAGHQIAHVDSLDRNEHYNAEIILIATEDSDELSTHCSESRRHPSIKMRPLLVVIPEKLIGDLDFSLGMDDILLLPWRPAELLLRVSLAMWRKDRTGSAQILKLGDIIIDLVNYTVRQHGHQLDLTLKEYELLCYLAANPGRVFTRAVLLSNVWGYEYFGGTRTVDVHVRRLRAKLGDWGEEMIQTVRGVGYRFNIEKARSSS